MCILNRSNVDTESAATQGFVNSVLLSAAPHLVVELTDALLDLLRLVQQDGISLREVWRKQEDRSGKLTEDALLIQYHVKLVCMCN